MANNPVVQALMNSYIPRPGDEDLMPPDAGQQNPERDINSILSIAGARLSDRLSDAGVSIAQALMAPGNAVMGQYDQRPVYADGSVGMFDPRMEADAANLAGLVSLGAAPIPRPTNSVGMGGIASRGIAAIEEKARNLGVRLDLSETPNGIVISRIVVPEGARGSGIGTSVMRMIADYADSVSMPVALTPTSDFGGNVRRLTDFYKNQGFVSNSGRNKDFSFRETMIRPPQ